MVDPLHFFVEVWSVVFMGVSIFNHQQSMDHLMQKGFFQVFDKQELEKWLAELDCDHVFLELAQSCTECHSLASLQGYEVQFVLEVKSVVKLKELSNIRELST